MTRRFLFVTSWTMAGSCVLALAMSACGGGGGTGNGGGTGTGTGGAATTTGTTGTGTGGATTTATSSTTGTSSATGTGGGGAGDFHGDVEIDGEKGVVDCTEAQMGNRIYASINQMVTLQCQLGDPSTVSQISMVLTGIGVKKYTTSGPTSNMGANVGAKATVSQCKTLQSFEIDVTKWDEPTRAIEGTFSATWGPGDCGIPGMPSLTTGATVNGTFNLKLKDFGT